MSGITLFVCFKYLTTFFFKFLSAEANDWGEVYPNLTGYGSLGMVAKSMAEIAIGAMYSW